MRTLFLILSLLTMQCVGNVAIEEKRNDIVPAMYPPVITPDGMIFSTSQMVVLSTDARTQFEGYIVYSIDNTQPDCLSSPVYSGPLTLTSDTMLRVKQCTKILSDAYFESAVGQAYFFYNP